MGAAKSLSCVGGLAAVLLLFTPAEAEACSCFPVLEVGQVRELPVNGTLLVQESCGADVTGITVTVDGEPATLSPLTGGPGDAFTVEISPPLEVGQRIEIDRSDPDFAPDIPSVSLMVVEEDSSAPVLADLSVTFMDPPESDTCSESLDALGVLSVSVDETSLDDGTRFEFVVSGDGEILGSGSSGRFYLQDDNTTAGYSRTIVDAVDELCVAVTAIDAAGNRSETLEDCVEGTGSEADRGESGCGCTAAPPTGSERWLAFLALVMVAGLGRRSRRRVLAR